MLELIDLIERSSATIHADLRVWFGEYSAAASWSVVSDFSVGDSGKQNDAYSFVIILKHDTDENIASYIAATSPSDLKASRTPPRGLLDYLCCPVTFSLSFVVSRESASLRAAITQEAMSSIVASLREIVAEWTAAEPPNAEYYGQLDRRLRLLESELARKQPSLNLLRRIFLVASFAAVVLGMLNDAKSPINIRWISDRDAMFDRHEGVAFDLAWLLFQFMRRRRGGVIDLRRPQITFATPGMDGKTEYAEFVRMPDFLAGTLADIKLPQLMFTHRKFPTIFNRVLVNSPNNAVVELLADEERVTSRRIGFGNRLAEDVATARKASET
ncbi:hypothetical protein [Sphingobium sp. EP60837]|uniref:hypothetical protein n=1 Tax=Sphingobium sp. EP60837 TaxID=1855519 RepID=UPI0007DDE757|nr:hypothetical protein [Sphingobium sp. EP60837]ANI80415.1 hypothetical protein EP837_04037 [Sphingobium sp. EP60837]